MNVLGKVLSGTGFLNIVKKTETNSAEEWTPLLRDPTDGSFSRRGKEITYNLSSTSSSVPH